MTDNPIDMAIELLEEIKCEVPAADLYPEIEVKFCRYAADKASKALKTYRDECISIKKSDVPEDLPKVLKKYEKPEPCPIYSIVEAARLVAKAMEVEDE